MTINQTEIKLRGNFADFMLHPYDKPTHVYLAGGALRAPWIEEKIRKHYDGVKTIFDKDKLELITSQGAMIRALQILNGEDEPMIKELLDEMKSSKW